MENNRQGLPADIREEQARQNPPPRREMGGIGASAHENAGAAKSRDFAVSGGQPPAETPEDVEKAEEESKELLTCPSPPCGVELDSEWSYCAKCGADLLRGGLEKRLGIEFTEDDVSDYIFKGFIVKEIKIMGKHKAVLKTSQPKDLAEIDDFIMNGDWTKGEKGAEKNISDFYLRQMNVLSIAAVAIQKLDGNSIGENLTDKVKWLNERGSAFVDRLTERVSLYNQALTEHLKKEDTISGS